MKGKQRFLHEFRSALHSDREFSVPGLNVSEELVGQEKGQERQGRDRPAYSHGGMQASGMTSVQLAPSGWYQNAPVPRLARCRLCGR